MLFELIVFNVYIITEIKTVFKEEIDFFGSNINLDLFYFNLVYPY